MALYPPSILNTQPATFEIGRMLNATFVASAPAQQGQVTLTGLNFDPAATVKVRVDSEGAVFDAIVLTRSGTIPAVTTIVAQMPNVPASLLANRLQSLASVIVTNPDGKTATTQVMLEIR